MASGRNHQAINMGALVLGTMVLAYGIERGWGDPWLAQIGVEWPVVVAFTAAFLFGTYLVTPDLDLAEQHVLAKRNWGLLGFIWVPYGYLFSHRGVSHGWFFGPLTRLLYLAGVAAAGLGIAYYATQAAGMRWPWSIYDLHWYSHWMWPLGSAIAGFYLSQWLHSLADGVGPLHGLQRLVRKLMGR